MHQAENVIATLVTELALRVNRPVHLKVNNPIPTGYIAESVSLCVCVAWQ